jgi:hypothetical protein
VPKQKTYQFDKKTNVNRVVKKLGKALEQWFRQEEYETQSMPAGEGRFVVQAKKGKGFMQSLVPAALTVDLAAQDDKLIVQWGNAKWGLQAATGIVSLIIFWPVAAVPAWVAYKQKQLIDGALDFLNQNIAALGGAEVMSIAVMPVAEAPATASVEQEMVKCPECGQEAVEGTKFCENCGTALIITCAGCGKTLSAGTKFCPECGTPTAEPAQAEAGAG